MLQDPVITVFSSGLPGPRVAVMAGVHGDEPTGPAVLANIVKRELIRPIRGELLVIVANPTAVKLRKRQVSENLNALFVMDGDPIAPEVALAHRLMVVMSSCDALLDIHEHKDQGVGSIAIPNRYSYEYASQLRADHIVKGLDSVEPGATDSFMADIGKIGICLELGMAGVDNSRVAYAMVRRFLAAAKIIEAPMAGWPTATTSRLSALQLIVKKSSGFRYSNDVVSCRELPPGPFAWDQGICHQTGGRQAIIFPRPSGPIGSSVGVLADITD